MEGREGGREGMRVGGWEGGGREGGREGFHTKTQSFQTNIAHTHPFLLHVDSSKLYVNKINV